MYYFRRQGRAYLPEIMNVGWAGGTGRYYYEVGEDETNMTQEVTFLMDDAEAINSKKENYTTER
jgi:hypothetical protein